MNKYFSLKYVYGSLVYLNQTRLPHIQEYIETTDYLRVAEAIETLELRGAPLIGIAAAWGVVLAARQNNNKDFVTSAIERLAHTRPTAVNLFWALEQMRAVVASSLEGETLVTELENLAAKIQADDEDSCRLMAEHGCTVFTKKSRVLTHCNTGTLAVTGEGTALAVIREAHRRGLVEIVFADETRPLFQGLRLTAFELKMSEIPFKLQVDSAAALSIKENKIDLVITGADRIAANGDSANKVGTLMLAILCRYYGIPFYIAAPFSTIDPLTKSGDEIPIEQRSGEEILSYAGTSIGTPGTPVYAPAFDVTPADLITGIITERGVFTYPYNFA